MQTKYLLHSLSLGKKIRFPEKLRFLDLRVHARTPMSIFASSEILMVRYFQEDSRSKSIIENWTSSWWPTVLNIQTFKTKGAWCSVKKEVSHKAQGDLLIRWIGRKTLQDSIYPVLLSSEEVWSSNLQHQLKDWLKRTFIVFFRTLNVVLFGPINGSTLDILRIVTSVD